MCIKIVFLCPSCKFPSGVQEYDKCLPEHGKCPGVERLNLFHKVNHFQPWTCANLRCRFSKPGEQVAALEHGKAIRRQVNSSTKPMLPMIRPGVLSASTVSQSHKTNSAMNVNRSAWSQKPVQAADMGPVPQWVHNIVVPLVSENDNPKKPVKSVPTNPTQKKVTAKPWVNIAGLGPNTRQKIQELRGQVNRLGTASKAGAAWLRSETDLLVICRQCEFPMEQIASYIPRHGLAGCEARLRNMRNMEPISKTQRRR